MIVDRFEPESARASLDERTTRERSKPHTPDLPIRATDFIAQN